MPVINTPVGRPAGRPAAERSASALSGDTRSYAALRASLDPVAFAEDPTSFARAPFETARRHLKQHLSQHSLASLLKSYGGRGSLIDFLT